MVEGLGVLGPRPSHESEDQKARSCSIRGSVSAWELWWVPAEGEECEGDEGLGSVEPERDRGEQTDLGVGTGSVGRRLQ